VTTALVTVILGTRSATAGGLALCPRCFETCYQPLVQEDSDAPAHALLVVATDAAGRPRC